MHLMHVSEILLQMFRMQGGLIAFRQIAGQKARACAHASLSRLYNSRCKTVLKDLQREIGTKRRSSAITYLF